MKKYIFILLIILLVGCAKKVEFEKTGDKHWTFKASRGIETTVETDKYKVKVDTKKEVPKVETNSSGIFDNIKNMVPFAWIPFI